MKSKEKRRNIRYGMIAVLCLEVLITSGRPLAARRIQEVSTNQEQPKSSLLILVKPQQGTPLIISGITVADDSDPQMPTVRFTVTNETRKRIMAYAIRHDAALTQFSVPGNDAVNYPNRNAALPAGAEVQMEISGIRYSEPPANLTLSVDFVEFVNGSRWGPDTFKNGEQIDGVRAGAKTAKEAMRKALEINGLEVFIHSLDSFKVEVEEEEPSLHSSKWLEGFRHGVAWMRDRVRSKGKDLVEIKRELQ